MQDKLMADVVNDYLKEKRRDRRWKNIRFFIWILLIAGGVYLFSPDFKATSIDGQNTSGYISLVRLEGSIESGRSFSSEEVVPLLREAFADAHAKGVIIDIDSGGGSPVQASIIHDAIVDLKNKYHKRVIVVGEDLLTSGAYFVAVGADKIYVNPNTLTGSVGVVMKEFGFADLIKRMGIERRVYTSGIDKDRLDPFLPQSTEDVAKIKSVMAEVHSNFEEVVLAGRKGKLKAKPEELFTGDFWSGATAVKLGLVDGLGNLSDVMHKEFNVSAYKNYSHGTNILTALFGQLGTSFALALTNNQVKIEEK